MCSYNIDLDTIKHIWLAMICAFKAIFICVMDGKQLSEGSIAIQ